MDTGGLPGAVFPSAPDARGPGPAMRPAPGVTLSARHEQMGTLGPRPRTQRNTSACRPCVWVGVGANSCMHSAEARPFSPSGLCVWMWPSDPADLGGGAACVDQCSHPHPPTHASTPRSLVGISGNLIWLVAHSLESSFPGLGSWAASRCSPGGIESLQACDISAMPGMC